MHDRSERADARRRTGRFRADRFRMPLTAMCTVIGGVSILVVGFACVHASAAEPSRLTEPIGPLVGAEGTQPVPPPELEPLTAPGSKRANFLGEFASVNVRDMADWVMASGDNHKQPFIIIDKKVAKAFAFGPDGQLHGATPVLLGLAAGDDSVPGIGERKLASIRPEERTTPAGRFVASLGYDLNTIDVLWVDYDTALSLHRVITGTAKDRRLQRLATASPLDNRISYGCINVPVKFYETVVTPDFTGTNGIVYILPEIKSTREVFPTADVENSPNKRPGSASFLNLDRLPSNRAREKSIVETVNK